MSLWLVHRQEFVEQTARTLVDVTQLLSKFDGASAEPLPVVVTAIPSLEKDLCAQTWDRIVSDWAAVCRLAGPTRRPSDKIKLVIVGECENLSAKHVPLVNDVLERYPEARLLGLTTRESYVPAPPFEEIVYRFTAKQAHDYGVMDR